MTTISNEKRSVRIMHSVNLGDLALVPQPDENASLKRRREGRPS